MDIEEFYEQDERRRASPEIEMGTEWLDHRGQRYELNWVQDTGELYVMHEPIPPESMDLFGGIHVNARPSAPIDGLQVTVLGTVASHDDLGRLLAGWESEVGQPGSVHWLDERLRAAGVLSAVAEEAGPD